MKIKIIAIITIVSSLFVGCNENIDKLSDVMDGADLGSAIPYTKFLTPKIFDIANLDTYKMQFELNIGAVGNGKRYKRIIINKSYNGSDTIEHASIESSVIPFEVSISAEDALSGFDGVTLSNVKGGDYIDWIFLIEFEDGSNGNYAAEAANSFPNFRAFFASSLDFELEGSYMQTVIETNYPEKVTTVLDAQPISIVPGTGASQYIVNDMSCGIINARFEVGPLNYRLYYIGNNKFILNSASEAFPTDVLMSGEVELDPVSGVINFNVLFTDQSCCGLPGKFVKFKMEPIN